MQRPRVAGAVCCRFHGLAAFCSCDHVIWLTCSALSVELSCETLQGRKAKSHQCTMETPPELESDMERQDSSLVAESFSMHNPATHQPPAVLDGKSYLPYLRYVQPETMIRQMTLKAPPLPGPSPGSAVVKTRGCCRGHCLPCPASRPPPAPPKAGDAACMLKACSRARRPQGWRASHWPAAFKPPGPGKPGCSSSAEGGKPRLDDGPLCDRLHRRGPRSGFWGEGGRGTYLPCNSLHISRVVHAVQMLDMI